MACFLTPQWIWRPAVGQQDRASGPLGNGTYVGVPLSLSLIFYFFASFTLHFIVPSSCHTSPLSFFWVSGAMEWETTAATAAVLAIPESCTQPHMLYVKISIQKRAGRHRQGVVEEYSQVSEQTSEKHLFIDRTWYIDVRSIISIIQMEYLYMSRSHTCRCIR